MPDKLQYAPRRTKCPSCRHNGCFSKIKGSAGGKCHRCGVLIPPSSSVFHAPPFRSAVKKNEMDKPAKILPASVVSASLKYIERIQPHPVPRMY